MTMPAQKPHRSKQDYETPADFLAAVAQRFGAITFDLAATHGNAKAESFYTPEDNSLAQDWSRLSGTLFLNPPYVDIDPWASKCSESLARVVADPKRRNRHDWRLPLLTPASVGANWFANHVHRRALVLGLSPRITFVGEDDPYPKDLILSVFGVRPGFDVWRWK